MAALTSYAVMMARILSTLSPATPPPSGDNSPLGWVRYIGLRMADNEDWGALGGLRYSTSTRSPQRKGFAQPSGS